MLPGSESLAQSLDQTLTAEMITAIVNIHGTISRILKAVSSGLRRPITPTCLCASCGLECLKSGEVVEYLNSVSGRMGRS